MCCQVNAGRIVAAMCVDALHAYMTVTQQKRVHLRPQQNKRSSPSFSSATTLPASGDAL